MASQWHICYPSFHLKGLLYREGSDSRTENGIENTGLRFFFQSVGIEKLLRLKVMTQSWYIIFFWICTLNLLLRVVIGSGRQDVLLKSAFFFFLAAPWHMEFPGQGSDPSHSRDLSFSSGNARSLTPPHQARDQT